ncbi:signal peptidase I [Kitasatospora sp. NPDC059327]|uniref:signal peptidase I n=1 Tax=Kitasatospora sp. NPDC059327 TaxID=3346803 RepID=UPI0036CA7CE3
MAGPKRWPLWTAVGVGVAGLLTAAFGFALLAFGYSVHTLPGHHAMTPTLEQGGQIITEKVRGDEVRRGDVVVVDSPWGMRGPVAKRVIGLGGDHLACCPQDGLVLNGQPLAEPYTSQGSANGGFAQYDAVVPAGRLFLLGDNRVDSLDSRMYLTDQQGSVDASTVHERVVWHSGAQTPDFPGKLLGALAAIGGGVLLFLAGAIGAIVAGVVGARRRRRTPLPA